MFARALSEKHPEQPLAASTASAKQVGVSAMSGGAAKTNSAANSSNHQNGSNTQQRTGSGQEPSQSNTVPLRYGQRPDYSMMSADHSLLERMRQYSIKYGPLPW